MAQGLPRLTPLSQSTRFDIPSIQTPRISSPSATYPKLKTDPLLEDLSPTAVLEALRTSDTNLPLSGSKERLLVDSISEASQHERALGIRAALAGKKLREWVIELQAWDWPENGFEPRPEQKTPELYLGSLPQETIVEREVRIERIKDDLETLEVEDLKNYVRNVHLQPRSRAVSIGSQASISSTTYTNLADFNMLVTATIMQALPDLATLSWLLGQWTLRMVVLRQIPGFLQQLSDTESALESAWTAIGQAVNPEAGLALTQSTYEQIKQVLETRVTELAKKIDAILDALEGQDDSIPDEWIEDMEAAESDYKNWVVEAERLVRLYAWQSNKVESRLSHEQGIAPSDPDQTQTAKDSVPFLQDGKLENTLHEENKPTTALIAESMRQHNALQPSVANRSSGESISNDQTPTKHDTNVQQVDSPTKRGLFFMRNLPEGSGDSLSGVNQRDSSNQSGRRPGPLTLKTIDTSNELEDSTTSLSKVTTASSSGYTDMSSPQIMDASYVQFYKSPVDDEFPVGVTREAEDISSPSSTGYSAANRFKHGRSISAVEPMTRSRGSSFHLQNTSSGNDPVVAGLNSVDQKLDSEISVEQQIRNAQAELDADPSSPTTTDASPSIRVRKVRAQQADTSHDYLAPNQPLFISNPTQVEDRMTAKISRLLTNIPAPIKLASQAEAGELRNGKMPSLPSRQQRSVTPALTLSPVSSKPKSTSSNETGVRVYHLHQPGKEVPIKLFIRLVGSEERVMVRVGGGWADLAEYLKDYAMHHGRRSVSSNHFELQGLPTAQNAASSLFDSTKSPTASNNGTPSGKGVSPLGSPYTPDSIRQSESVPDTVESQTASRGTPSATNSSTGEEPSSVGLAGPKFKRIELSPQKKAWVDGMLHQARSISSEHKKTDDIGDLGKAGSTKRVFMKGRADSSSAQ